MGFSGPVFDQTCVAICIFDFFEIFKSEPVQNHGICDSCTFSIENEGIGSGSGEVLGVKRGSKGREKTGPENPIIC